MANWVSDNGDSDDDNFSLNSDDLSAESEVDMLERLAGEIFGDSNTDDDEGLLVLSSKCLITLHFR